MSELQITPFVADGQPTMSSREIAEMVKSRHDKVRQSIERLAERGVIQLPPLGEVRNHLGQAISEYVFAGEQGERDSIIVIAQLSPEHTATLVDAWRRLRQLCQDLITDALPKDFPSALRALADSVDRAAQLEQRVVETEAQKVELEHRVEEIGPKAEIYDKFLNADGLIGLQDLGRVLGQKPNKFIERLKPRYLFDQGGLPTPRQEFVERGIFRVTSVLVVDKIRKRTWVTAKGVQYFAKKLSADIPAKAAA